MSRKSDITFATPEESKAGSRVKNGHQFELALSAQEWLRWPPALSVKP
ncbi:MAG: hypothetical protein ABI254_03960 [Chthoniobacterales bacterium]